MRRALCSLGGMILATALLFGPGAGSGRAQRSSDSGRPLCTASERVDYQTAARAYAKRMSRDRARYFKRHRNRKLRARFFRQQQARLTALRAKASCELIDLNPAPSPNQTFVFGPGMTADDQQAIESDIAFAAQDENRLVGLLLDKVTVFATTDADWLGTQQCAFVGRGGNCAHDVATFYASGNSAGQGGPGYVCIYWAARDWHEGAPHAQTILAHEVFHALQYQTDHLIHAPETPPDQIRPTGPVWLDEGAPEMIANRVTADRRLGVYTAALQSQILATKQISTPLDQLERLSQTNVANVYSLFALSIDYLAGTTPAGITALADYYRALGAGAPWPDAFSQAFAISVADYYTTFATYRHGL
jgi:hypothetical protein